MTDFIINSPKVTSIQLSNSVYELTLDDTPDGVLAIRDRPNRSYRFITNQQFSDLWSVGGGRNSFLRDPPNAVLDFRNADKSRTDAPIIITNSRVIDGRLKMRVRVLPGILGNGIKPVMRNVVVWVDPHMSGDGTDSNA